MEIGDKYLPIGTVVKLKEGIKKLMITGYCFREENNPTVVWDYTGCLYPEGILVASQLVVFNHSQIEEIYYKGLEDEEVEEFMKMLEEMSKKEND